MAGAGDEYYYVRSGPRGAPHGLLLAVVVGLVVAGPLFLDTEATRLLNLIVLQRLDPAVEDILITAAHVTLYDFNMDLNQWNRKDIEGSMFVVKRNSQPRF